MPEGIGTHVAEFFGVSRCADAKGIQNRNDCPAHARTLAEPLEKEPANGRFLSLMAR
jgi:hypothetical protein